MSRNTQTRYVIVPRRPDRRPLWWVVLGLGWVLTLAVAWSAASRVAAPRLPDLTTALDSAHGRLQQAERELAELRQRQATLERSDQISRAANREVQQALAERDGQIADLRANLAFYERLAGATKQPKGLSVHSADFMPETAGTWQYRIVLTQSLNRGAVTAGKLRFDIEGVRDGKLAVIDWADLHQRDAAPPQPYSFRYFQQLQGSVMLPVGFVPQRVRVSLRGENASLEQAVAWVQPSETGET